MVQVVSMIGQLKKTLFVFGVTGLTLGILWFASFETNDEPRRASPDLALIEEQDETQKIEDSFWFQLMPKSSIAKRDEQRVIRQQEIASMIDRLQGVDHTTVVLSDNEATGLGMPKRPMTACVSVEPTQGIIPRATIRAIRKLVAGATMGLSPDQVTVLNNQTGMESSDVSVTVPTSLNTEVMRKNIERALGLRLATISVSMNPISTNDIVIPWRNNVRPEVRVTLPSSWVKKRVGQVGSEEVLFDSLRSIISGVAPSVLTHFQVVHDVAITSMESGSSESYAKYIAVALGLFAILSSVFIAYRRKENTQTIVVQHVADPREEAKRIIELEHFEAKEAISALYGTYKTNVLKAIVAVDEEKQPPIVEVHKQLELTKCG